MKNQYLQKLILLLAALVFAAACSQIGTGGNIAVPTTGDTSSDASAAQRLLPNIQGFTTIEASNIVDAISAVGGGASVLTGNPVAAAMVAQIQGMMDCYGSVGAVAARVYIQADIGSVMQGQVPLVGAMAVVNQDRVVNNFLPCALGANNSGFSARSAVQQPQPCGGSGSTTVNNETILYLYAATDQALCGVFQSVFPG